MQEPNSVAELIGDLGHTITKQPFHEFQFGLVDEFEDIAVSGVLADEVDVIPVVEEAVNFGDVGMVQEVIDLDLSKNVFNNVQLDHLPLLQHFYSAEEAGFFVNSSEDFTVRSFS